MHVVAVVTPGFSRREHPSRTTAASRRWSPSVPWPPINNERFDSALAFLSRLSSSPHSLFLTHSIFLHHPHLLTPFASLSPSPPLREHPEAAGPIFTRPPKPSWRPTNARQDKCETGSEYCIWTRQRRTPGGPPEGPSERVPEAEVAQAVGRSGRMLGQGMEELCARLELV